MTCMILRISNPRADTPVAIMMGDLPFLKARLENVSKGQSCEIWVGLHSIFALSLGAIGMD